jgi:hypothetical protein
MVSTYIRPLAREPRDRVAEHHRRVVDLSSGEEVEVQEAPGVRWLEHQDVPGEAQRLVVSRADPASTREDAREVHPAGVEVVVAVPLVERDLVADLRLHQADPDGADVDLLTAQPSSGGRGDVDHPVAHRVLPSTVWSCLPDANQR